MANRIKISCLGASLAPYSTNNIQVPAILTGQISEYLSFGVEQIQIGYDTTSAIRSAYPLALSVITVKYVQANHFETGTFFVNSTQDQINNAANT